MLTARPKISELSLTLFGRSVHPELFDAQQRLEVERSNYFCRLDIINSGHVFYFQSDLTKLTEVTASSHHPLPSSRLIDSKPFQNGFQESVENRGRVDYRSEFQIERVEPDMFWSIQNQLSKATPQNGIIHRFDSSGRIPFGGISFVHTVARENALFVQAIHTFPDDQAIVKTESEFKISPV